MHYLLTSMKCFRSVMITRAAEGFSTIFLYIRLYFQVNNFMLVKVNRVNSFHIFYTQRVFLQCNFFHANQEKLKCWKFSCNVYMQKPSLQFEPFHECSDDTVEFSTMCTCITLLFSMISFLNLTDISWWSVLHNTYMNKASIKCDFIHVSYDYWGHWRLFQDVYMLKTFFSVWIFSWMFRWLEQVNIFSHCLNV